MNQKSMKGVAIAGALAAMFVGSTTPALGKTHKTGSKMVNCMKGNACKAKSSCSADGNGCAGKNECKGQGMSKEKNPKACIAKGGTVVADSKDK